MFTPAASVAAWAWAFPPRPRLFFREDDAGMVWCNGRESDSEFERRRNRCVGLCVGYVCCKMLGGWVFGARSPRIRLRVPSKAYVRTSSYVACCCLLGCLPAMMMIANTNRQVHVDLCAYVYKSILPLALRESGRHARSYVNSYRTGITLVIVEGLSSSIKSSKHHAKNKIDRTSSIIHPLFVGIEHVEILHIIRRKDAHGRSKQKSK